MARVTCSQCGTVRVVTSDKRKRCRRCGTWLSADSPSIKDTKQTGVTPDSTDAGKQTGKVKGEPEEVEQGTDGRKQSRR